MLRRRTVLHQHGIHVRHNGLEEVGGDTRAANLRRLNIPQCTRSLESNTRSDLGIRVGEANFLVIFCLIISKPDSKAEEIGAQTLQEFWVKSELFRETACNG
jgi:hypothetical protein